MNRLSCVLTGFGVLFFGCAAGPQLRPPVDEAAMREAMLSGAVGDEGFASSSSYAHYLRARIAHHDGDHRRAMDELLLAIATDEGNPFLRTSLAEEYARLSDMERAERELKRVIERHPGYQPAQLLMGRVLFETQKFTRAKVHLRRAIKLRPKDPDAYLVLTQLHLELNQPDEAVKRVEELGEALPGEPVGFKRLGMALAERNDFARAERLLRKAIERDPGDFDSWVSLAQLLDTNKRESESEEAYSRALEQDPDNREVLLAAGRLALKLGSSVRARAYFDRLLSLSDDPELAVKVAFSYLATRELSAAAEVLDAARRTRTKEPRISFYAGLVHEKLRRFPQAAEAYAEVPTDNELFHEARLHRAMAVSQAGQHAKAFELFKQGLVDRPDYLQLYPAYARALERSGAGREAEKFLAGALKDRPAPELFEALASTFQRQGRLADAISLLATALAKRPRDEMLMFTLGAAYERKGEVDKSIAQMRQVLEVNPDNAAALNFIGYTLADKGKDFDEAEKLLVRALQLRPDSGAFLDSLGWVYYRRGDFARAVDTLQRAEQLSPNEPMIIEHLADAYQRSSKRGLAAEAYRRALEALKESEPDEVKGRREGLVRKLKMLGVDTADR